MSDVVNGINIGDAGYSISTANTVSIGSTGYANATGSIGFYQDS